jgi:hypothetical protein
MTRNFSSSPMSKQSVFLFCQETKHRPAKAGTSFTESVVCSYVKMSTNEGVLPPDHLYVVASKQIKGVEDMPKWEHSEAYQVNSLKYIFIQNHFTTVILSNGDRKILMARFGCERFRISFTIFIHCILV